MVEAFTGTTMLIPGGTVSYDGNGNLTNDTFHTYTWDAEGNPATIDTYSFSYDAFDRRVEYGNGTSWTQYLYSPSNPGTIVGGAAAQVLTLRIALPAGGQAIMTSSGVNNYRRPNWQGSEPIQSSTTKTVINDSAYTPFGEHYQVNVGDNGYYAGNLSVSPVFTDGYAGTFRLYHYDQGRWISPDPAGLSAVDPTNPQSWNRYGYLMNNPLSGMDTSGMGGNCTTYSGVNSQGYWITIYCTYYSGVIVINVPVGGPTAGVGQTGGGGTPSSVVSGTVATARCAAQFSSNHSIAAGLDAVSGGAIGKDNPLVSGLFGSDASTVSNWITGQGNQEMPSQAIAKGVGLVGRGVGSLPNPLVNGLASLGNAVVKETPAGTAYAAAWTDATIATSLLGRIGGRLFVFYTAGKAVWDVSTYAYGAFVACQ